MELKPDESFTLGVALGLLMGMGTVQIAMAASSYLGWVERTHPFNEWLAGAIPYLHGLEMFAGVLLLATTVLVMLDVVTELADSDDSSTRLDA